MPNEGFRDVRANFYVDPQYGYDGNVGTSAGLAFRSMSPLTKALTDFRNYGGGYGSNQPIVVALTGVLSQQWTAPIISDVAIIGVGSVGRPRQATTSGVANGGGATWLSPSNLSNSEALINIRGQAWRLENIYFNNSATGAPDVMLTVSGSGDPPTDPDASHAVLKGCVFTGTDDGVSSTGLPNFVTIEDCTFFGFSGASDLGISYAVGGGVKTLSDWRILRNEFLGNTGHITAAFANAEIAYNRFSYIWSGTTSTTQVVLTSGSNNSVHDNNFDVPYSTNGITAMFALGTNDRWSFNKFATAVTTTIFSFGAPSS